MLAIIYTILIFGVLIFVHELGHFLAARLSGVTVLEFAIGMGPAIFKKQGKKTLYSIRLLPIGGYCSMEGETEDFRLPFARKAAALAFCLCFVATSISATQQFFAQNYRGNPHLEEVTDWVTQQGYTQGYATFWNANVVTEWSSGQLEMWCVRDFNTMITSPRLQKISHQTPPQGALFLLTPFQRKTL